MKHKIDIITPDEVKEFAKNEILDIPDEVIRIFNQLIIENFKKNKVVFRAKTIYKIIKKRLKIKNKEIDLMLFSRGCLNKNLIDILANSGWDIKYIKSQCYYSFIIYPKFELKERKEYEI